jgi:metal transporter CNNM
MDYLITVILLLFSALFSGLTLGFMSLDVYTLKRKARLGDRQAKRILPVRQKGNHLLTTLLLGNVAVNAVLAIYLGSIATGVVAGILATSLIFIFGEIVPQAVVSRHAMFFGSHTAPAIGFLMKASWPLTYPIAYALDHVLGKELPTLYSKHELMEIISEHEDAKESTIDQDEERIVHGALQFSNKPVSAVMTPKDTVTLLDANRVLDESMRSFIKDEGYSRYPVYAGSPRHISGILYIRDIIVAPFDAKIGEVCERGFLRVRLGEKLDNVLGRMLKHQQHMGIVLDEQKNFVGVITLEDILEEVIQHEIYDEEDEVDPMIV